jgi:hypothetical protein
MHWRLCRRDFICRFPALIDVPMIVGLGSSVENLRDTIAFSMAFSNIRNIAALPPSSKKQKSPFVFLNLIQKFAVNLHKTFETGGFDEPRDDNFGYCRNNACQCTNGTF